MVIFDRKSEVSGFGLTMTAFRISTNARNEEIYTDSEYQRLLAYMVYTHIYQ